MHAKIPALPLCFWLSLVAFAQTSTQTSAPQSSQQTAMPYTPSLDVNSMDKSADPCVELYQYSCGGWKKNNPIPPDQTSWEVYGKLYEDNLNFLRSILERASGAMQRDAITQKIGDFYGACMDESAVQKRGLSPVQGDLDAISKLNSVKG